ncbi:MAG: MFS transporter [Armatimonadota bacterium]|nr:MAG: MFS transporter [Armatimonadota bacterium]
MRTTASTDPLHDHYRETPRLVRARLLAGVAVMHVAMGTAGVGISLLAIALGADSLALGVIGTVGTVVYTGLAFTFGRLSDRGGRMILVRVAPLAYAAALLAATLGKTWQHLIPIAVVTAVSMAMLWPAYMAMVAEAAPRGRLAGQIAAYNVAWCSGITVGNSLGGTFSGQFVTLPLYVASALAIVVALMLAGLRPGARSRDDAASDGPPDGVVPVSVHRARALLLASWCAMFASVFGAASLRVLFPKLALDLEFQPAVIGLVLAALTAGQAIMFLVLGGGAWWRYRLLPLVLVQGASAVAYVAVGLVRAPAAFGAAFAVIGAAGALAYTSSYYYGVNRAARRGAFTGIHEAILGAGGALSPLLGGILAREVSLRLPYFVAGGVIVAAIGVEVALHGFWQRGERTRQANRDS